MLFNSLQYFVFYALVLAAYWILTRKSRECSGHHFIDEAVLRDSGVTDFDAYANDPSHPLFTDLLVDEPDGLYFKGSGS